jgi:UDP-N-acetylglucosamine:LPS N-acetylglucosamine transferase
MASSHGVLCGAGFETPAEALYLGKKLLVVPMVNQYEQQCNAASLKELGIHVIRKFNDKAMPVIREWLDSDYKIEIRYPDQTEQIVNHIFELFVTKDMKRLRWDKDYALTFPEKGGKQKAADYRFFSKKKGVK